MHVRKTFVLLAAVALVAGCLEYDERIELNPDGSGVVRIHLTIAEQAMALHGQAEAKSEADLFPMPPGQFADELKAEKLEVLSLRAESKGGMRHFYIVIAFRDVQDLVRSEYFGGREFTFRKEKDNLYRVKQTLDVAAGMSDDKKDDKPEAAPAEKDAEAPADGKPEPPEDETPAKPDLKRKTFAKQMDLNKERMKKVLKNASLKFSVELVGGHVHETDGRSHRSVVSTWTFPLEDLVDKKPKLSMEAVFSSDPPPVVEEEKP